MPNTPLPSITRVPGLSSFIVLLYGLLALPLRPQDQEVEGDHHAGR